MVITQISPVKIFSIEQSFKSSKLGDSNFLKGCKWSPDGLCVLTANDDFHLRLFELPDSLKGRDDLKNEPVLKYKDGGTIYDFCWYPNMSSNDPVSCVFASSSRGSPIHLWDAYNGLLRATYQPINQFDEVVAAYSICFSPCNKLYAGFKKEVKIFDISLPGREFENRPLKNPDWPTCQSGIVSAITVNPVMPSLYAVGSYDKSIGIYTESEGDLQYVLKAHQGGVTHLLFSPDGQRLYSGGRQDSEILCWDLRQPGTLLFAVARVVKTCQRIYFDLTADGRFLATGSTDGNVEIFDTNRAVGDNNYLEGVVKFVAHRDCTNSISFKPKGKYLVTGSGQRHASLNLYDDDDEDESDDVDENNKSSCAIENSMNLWSLSLT